MAGDEDHIEDGEEKDTQEVTQDLWREMIYKAAEMQVHFGLFMPVLDQYPEHVRENLDNEMKKVIEYLDGEVDFIQSFAEALD